MRMSDIPSLDAVSKESSRRYSEDYAENARVALKQFVATFKSQEEAAAALGFDQGTISRSTNAANQPTLKVLIALRDKTGRSLDEILGLPAPKNAAPPNDEEIGRFIGYIAKRLPPSAPLALVPRRETVPLKATPPSPPKEERDPDKEVRPGDLPSPKRTKKKKSP